MQFFFDTCCGLNYKAVLRKCVNSLWTPFGELQGKEMLSPAGTTEDGGNWNSFRWRMTECRPILGLHLVGLFGFFICLFAMGQALPKPPPVPVDRVGFSRWRSVDGHRKDEWKRTLQSACVHEFDHFMAALSPWAVQGSWKSTKEMTWSSVPVSSKH